MTDHITTRDDGQFECTDRWLPFDADITVDLREDGEMVVAGTNDGAPVTMVCTIGRVEPPLPLEHTHAGPGSTMRWELEAVETGCILRSSRDVPQVRGAIDGYYLVGLRTRLDRLTPALSGGPRPWDRDASAADRVHDADLGLAAPVDAP